MRITRRPSFEAVRLFAAFLLAAGTALAQAEQVYRWQDKDGNVHFGDKPPAADAEIVTIRSSPAEDQQTAGRLDRTNKLLNTLAEDRRAKKDARANAEAERRKRAAQCAQARVELERMRTARYLYSKNQAGRRQVLSFERRAAAEQEASAKVDELCGAR